MQSGLMDDGVKLSLLGSWMALFVIFAGRKFTQPIKVPYYLGIIGLLVGIAFLCVGIAIPYYLIKY